MIEPCLDAVAVEFDFVQPIFSARCRVVQRGENLLISAELMDARDATLVWGEEYNRKRSDLLVVQADISREIAETLRLRLTAGERQQLVKRETVNPHAYELLIKLRGVSRGRRERRRIRRRPSSISSRR